MQGQRLNLKFTVAHTDRIIGMAKLGWPAKDIAADINRHVPCTIFEVERICAEAHQFVRKVRA